MLSQLMPCGLKNLHSQQSRVCVAMFNACNFLSSLHFLPSHPHSLPPLISLQTSPWLGSSLRLPTLKLAALLSSTAQYLVPLAPPYDGTTTQPSSQTPTPRGYRYLPPASSQSPVQLSTILGSTHATLVPAMHTVLPM